MPVSDQVLLSKTTEVVKDLEELEKLIKRLNVNFTSLQTSLIRKAAEGAE